MIIESFCKADIMAVVEA